MDHISHMICEQFEAAEAEKIYGNMIEHIEKVVIIKALEHSCGNQIVAARLLGLHRNTLHNKIKKFRIDVGRFKK
ncbi:MAG: helix-turn-helix domain-containing protein [Candidatus Omnitrophota bacterium]